jgi:hypothetical protein
MDFSQYLDAYLQAKRLRGVTPTQAQAGQLFSPYFQDQAQGEQTARRLDLGERSLASHDAQAADSLAFEKYKQDAMMRSAERGDNNAMIGNTLQTAGSLGNLALLKKYGWFDRRYR